MTIEFQCPHCSSTIRVADEFAGRQGRCPRCERRLIVPHVEPPDSAPSMSGAESARPDSGGSQSTSPAHETSAAVRQTGDDTLVADSQSTAEPGLPPGGAGFPDEFPVPVASNRVTSASSRRTRRLQQRRRNQRVLMVGIPVVCFLIVFAWLATLLMDQLPELKGQLQATRIAESRLPPVSVSWNETGLTEAERESLKSLLQQTPETFTSSLMTCSLSADDSGLIIQLNAAAGQSWVMIDPAQNEALKRWAEMQKSTLSGLRSHALHASIDDYLRDKLLQATGQSVVIDAQRYRDDLCLNACVGGTGFVLQAALPGRVSRCALESASGQLFFLMPEETSGFSLNGRTLPTGAAVFPGEYVVSLSSETVEVSTEADVESDAADAAEAMPAESTDTPDR